MPDKLLITRPSHDDTTFYLAEWADDVKEIAEDKLGRQAVLDLKNERATRNNFESMIAKTSPTLLFLNGHGDFDSICGHEDEIILDLINVRCLQSKTVYARSCKTAKVLGFQSVKQGIAKAFIGYKNDFIFPYDERRTASPKKDTFCKPILNSSNCVVTSLVRGKTAKEAFNASQDTYDFYIRKWVNSKELEAPFVLKFLVWNKVNQICFER